MRINIVKSEIRVKLDPRLIHSRTGKFELPKSKGSKMDSASPDYDIRGQASAE